MTEVEIEVAIVATAVEAGIDMIGTEVAIVITVITDTIVVVIDTTVIALAETAEVEVAIATEAGVEIIDVGTGTNTRCIFFFSGILCWFTFACWNIFI